MELHGLNRKFIRLGMTGCTAVSFWSSGWDLSYFKCN